MPFRIKICGITRPEDGIIAAQAGADAIGLNFYSGSTRFVTLEHAQQVAAALPAGVKRVGVFVNDPIAAICHFAKAVPLDIVQLHGEEPPALLAQLTDLLPAGVEIVRAWRQGSGGLMPLRAYIDDSQRAGRAPDAVLMDARVPGSYGGTGTTLDWHDLADRRGEFGNMPFLLAGGLKPSNVAEAIATCCPAGVDVAGGVESAPGIKDHALVRAFIANAEAALAKLPPRLG